jgi:hypothetical protein
MRQPTQEEARAAVEKAFANADALKKSEAKTRARMRGNHGQTKEVDRERADKQPFSEPGAGSTVPTPNGEAMVQAVFVFLGRFVAYPCKHAHVAHTLWIAHTHLMDAWESTPRLALLSPEPASGKTRALEVSELLVPSPVEAVNVTPAYLFRKVGGENGPPTVLFDEIDTVFGPKAKENEEIRGLLNAGHRRGAVAGRCVVKGKVVETEEIPAYCAVALAGLGWLPDTLLSRSVIIRMRRRKPEEVIEPFRRRIHAAAGHALRDQLAAWAASTVRDMTEARPDMPQGVEDRDADVWESLLAIADSVGGDWPKAARDAAVALVAAAKESEPSLGIRLLADMRTAFGDADALATKTLLERLHAMEESPWNDIRGKALNDRSLAVRLREYGIRSKTLRIGDVTPKGYERADFIDVWARYLPPSSSPSPPAGSKTNATSATNADFAEVDVADVADSGANVADVPSENNATGSGPVVDVADVADVPASEDEVHRCDHCGSTGVTRPWDWPGRPDGIWLHSRCEEAWFDAERSAS